MTNHFYLKFSGLALFLVVGMLFFGTVSAQQFTDEDPPPQVSIGASPKTINPGESSTLSWSSSGATSCSASWTTSTATSGNQSVSPSSSTTYSITCTGAGGSTTASATVTVYFPAPGTCSASNGTLQPLVSATSQSPADWRCDLPDGKKYNITELLWPALPGEETTRFCTAVERVYATDSPCNGWLGSEIIVEPKAATLSVSAPSDVGWIITANSEKEAEGKGDKSNIIVYPSTGGTTYSIGVTSTGNYTITPTSLNLIPETNGHFEITKIEPTGTVTVAVTGLPSGQSMTYSDTANPPRFSGSRSSDGTNPPHTVATGTYSLSASDVTGCTKSITPSSTTLTSGGTISFTVAYNCVPGGDPVATLVVYSSGVTGVPISGTNGRGGTTNYTSTSTSAISTVLTAPATHQDGTFSSWSGCDSSSTADRTCTVGVNVENTKTVMAYYSVPTAPISLDLRLNGSTSDITLQSGDPLTYSWASENAAVCAFTSPFTAQVALSGSYTVESGHPYYPTEDNPKTFTITCNENTSWTGQSATRSLTASLETADPGLATLHVNSSGATGVTISAVGGMDGTTNYTRTSSNGILTNLTAPDTAPNGATFTSWTGCDGTSGTSCSVVVNVGTIKTITVNYSGGTDSFTYTLSNSGTTVVQKAGITQHGQNTITKTLTSATTGSVDITATGQPSGVSVSYGNRTCSPTCQSTVTFSVSPSAPTGTFPITVTGTPGNVTTQFDLRIDESPEVIVSCTASPSTPLIGEEVTWTASVSGGVAPYTYSWTGTNFPTDPAPTSNPFSMTYSTVGQKTAQAEARDSLGNTGTCTPAGTVYVTFDPKFEEF